MEDENPNTSEERSLWRKEPMSGHEVTAVYSPGKARCKATTVYSSDNDFFSPDITWLRPSEVTKEKDEAENPVVSNPEAIAPNDGMRVQAVVNTCQKQESCIEYAQNFKDNLLAQESTGRQEESHVLDLSVPSRRATVIQENGCEDGSEVSSERDLCAEGSQDGLRKRERSLTQKKPCKKKICQNSNKKRKDTDILSYICPECGMCFSSLLRFTAHQRLHTGGLMECNGTNAWGKPDTYSEDQVYICPECGKSFISFPSFVEHQKSHTGDMGPNQRTHAQNELYICSECGDCFYSFSLFTEHKKSHTIGETYTTGKGHNLLPWMLPGTQRMLHGQHANHEPMLGNAYPSPSPPLIWVPYSPTQINYSHVPLLSRFPVPHLQGRGILPAQMPSFYTHVSDSSVPPLPAQMSSLYTQASDSSAPGVLKQGGSFPQWRMGSVSSGSQKEEATASTGVSFVGRNEALAKILEDQVGKSHRLNPQPKLDLFQRNHAGQSLFPCLDCGELKVNPTQLTLHRRDCKREGLVRCPFCKKRFPNEQSFREHEKSHVSEDT